VIFRYFNVAGADPQTRLGKGSSGETHLIPILIDVLLGKLPTLRVYGTNYDTPDGTCIRDYIHVQDICQAHRLALNIETHKKILCCNLGSGAQHSVREVIAASKAVIDVELCIEYCDKRDGDVTRNYADIAQAKNLIGWIPKHSDLQSILSDAWRWHKRLADAGITA
jgi:UDP-glucose 4-epimerase